MSEGGVISSYTPGNIPLENKECENLCFDASFVINFVQTIEASVEIPIFVRYTRYFEAKCLKMTTFYATLTVQKRKKARRYYTCLPSSHCWRGRNRSASRSLTRGRK